jgi:hypothetical protein
LSRCALALAVLVTASHARADVTAASTSVELFGGYGRELVKVGSNGPTAHGTGLGMRAGLTLPVGLYAGGTFVEHIGWRQTASDPRETSTYRGAYHVTYGGAEVGWLAPFRTLILRPYVGLGALFAFGRTAVGRVERKDDNAFFYVAPGLLTAARAGRLYGGLDLRFLMIPAQPTTVWAPAVFLVGGTTL